jgi:Uma2 family endonuclease
MVKVGMMVANIKPVTLEEFDQYVFLPENAEKHLEYVGGEIVEVVSNNKSSRIGASILARLTIFAEDNDLGWVTGADGGYRVMGERYIPDAAFVSKKRQPTPSEEAYNSIAPDLAVEVLSPTDDRDKLRIKVVNYLLAGTRVWVVDPEKQQVEDYVPGQSPKTLLAEGILDGGDILPGFRLEVSRIFAHQG